MNEWRVPEVCSGWQSNCREGPLYRISLPMQADDCKVSSYLVHVALAIDTLITCQYCTFIYIRTLTGWYSFRQHRESDNILCKSKTRNDRSEAWEIVVLTETTKCGNTFTLAANLADLCSKRIHIAL